MRKLMSVLCVVTLAGATLLAADWPNWRGPTGNGVSAEKGLPSTWSATENVAWKLALPAFSGSTPIIWGDRIFLNVATAKTTGELELWAIDRNKKDVVWKRQIAGGNNQQRKQNMSSPSPVTDGKRVRVMTGVGILKAFDFAGTEIWSRDIQKDYGAFGLNWGYASSPLLLGNALYVQVLHGMKTDDPSYVMKIDADSGKTLWKVERLTDAPRESPDSYTTPTVITAAGRTDLIITGGDVVTGHDLTTGKELWRANVLNPGRSTSYRIVASPLIAGGLIISPSRNNPLVAIKPGGSGEVGGTHVAWSFTRGPDVPTPVSDGKYLYVVTDTGIVYCLDVQSGETVYGPERLPSDTYSSSPTLADGKIYVTGELQGVTSVFRTGPKFEVIASNSLGDGCDPYCLSTVAVSEGQLFIRTSAHLWAIGQRRAK